MAKGIKELRLRIRSIKGTKKITRAMEMVSAAKLRRAQNEMEAARPFTRKLQSLLGRLALSPTAQEHPLFENRSESGLPKLLLLITSDRGLCGAYNANLLKAAERWVKANPTGQMYIVGRKGFDYFRKRIADRIVGKTTDLNTKLDGGIAGKIGDELLALFTERKVAQIEIISAEFVSASTNRPRQQRYLALEAAAFGLSPEEASRPIDYLLEPSPERVFDALLPTYLRGVVYLALAEAFTCEHASRMLAMNAATKNCNELGDKLTLQMNKARQATITTEIIEIVSGAAALEG